MSKIRPDPGKPLFRAQARLYEADYDYVVRHLGGSVSGLQNEITRELFNRFARYLKTLNLEPYGNNPESLHRLRRALSRLCVTERDPTGYDSHG